MEQLKKKKREKKIIKRNLFFFAGRNKSFLFNGEARAFGPAKWPGPAKLNLSKSMQLIACIGDQACFDSLNIACFITAHATVQLRARAMRLNEA